MKLRVTLGGQWSAWETEWGSSGLVYGRKGPVPVSSLRVPGGLEGGVGVGVGASLGKREEEVLRTQFGVSSGLDDHVGGVPLPWQAGGGRREGMGPEAEFSWRARAVTPRITQDWRTLGSLPGPTILLPLDSISFKTALEPTVSTLS